MIAVRIPLSRAFLDDETRKAVLKAVDSGWYILAQECKAFEAELSAAFGSKHALLCSNGTAAIWLMLKALGVKAGDEILVPSLTAFPTVEPIFMLGAKPVYCDIDEHATMDPADARTKVTPRTVGILPVHLYGHPAAIAPLQELANEKKLWLAEDTCQGHFAKYRGKIAGTYGRAAALSFYVSKNLTVLGDGGAVLTSDDALAKAVKELRDHGRTGKYEHSRLGFNYRFNELQAAAGRVQLRHLGDFTKRRRAIAARYREKLKGAVELVPESADVESCYHLFVLRTKDRDGLAKHLESRGIQTGVHYPIPCHLQPASIAALGKGPALPRTEAFVNEILSLPIYPSLTDAEVDEIASEVRAFVR